MMPAICSWARLTLGNAAAPAPIAAPAHCWPNWRREIASSLFRGMKTPVCKRAATEKHRVQWAGNKKPVVAILSNTAIIVVSFPPNEPLSPLDPLRSLSVVTAYSRSFNCCLLLAVTLLFAPLSLFAQQSGDVPKGEVTKYGFDQSKFFPGTVRDF